MTSRPVHILLLMVALLCGATGAIAAPNNARAADKAEKAEKPEKAEKDDKPEKTNGRPPDAGPPPQARPPGGDGLPATNVDAATVLPKVATDDALSLKEVRAAVALISNGRVLDIRLVLIGTVLIYEVTVLESGNVARQLYIDAKTGQEIGSPL